MEIGDGTDADEFGDIANLQTAGRALVDPDAAQAAVWADGASADTTINITINSAGGSLSAGSARITVLYTQI